MSIGNKDSDGFPRFFCPQCGCVTSDVSQQCPQCGFMSEEARAVHRDVPDRPQKNMRIAVFLLGAFLLFLLTYYVGTYFLFLFFPIMFVKGNRSLAVMFFDGALVGAFAGLILSHVV